VAVLRVAVARAHDSPIVRADLAASQIYAGQLGEADETCSQLPHFLTSSLPHFLTSLLL
jgi:hypothetical protein